MVVQENDDTIHRLQGDICKQRDTIQRKEETIQRKNEDLLEQRETIQGRDQALEEQRERMQMKDEAIQWRDARIRELELSLNSLQVRLLGKNTVYQTSFNNRNQRKFIHSWK